MMMVCARPLRDSRSFGDRILKNLVLVSMLCLVETQNYYCMLWSAQLSLELANLGIIFEILDRFGRFLCQTAHF